MITYQKGLFGLQLLFRFHGSAVFKSLTLALLSSLVYIILYQTQDLQTDEGQILGHPYTIGALVSALTFLLAFRANFSYNRYWEACTSVHQMHSKWLDVGMEMAAFHLQSVRYDSRRPPAFGAHPDLTCVERQRERLNEQTLDELEEELEEIEDTQHSLRGRFSLLRKKGDKKSVKALKKKPKIKPKPKPKHAVVVKNINAAPLPEPTQTGGSAFGFSYHLNRFLHKRPSKKKVVRIATIKRKNEYDPSPFLLEGAHLLSLLSAVAMSTLRNDLEQAESPLSTFRPGRPWPCVDPDDVGADVRKDFSGSTHRTWVVLKYLFGVSRTPLARTLYNAARPFRVVGGVSDAEIDLLQAARGPQAKVALCAMWLHEYVSREYLAGSTGKVSPPIISRLYQFLSDGMIGYNQARKVAYIPFPFPHAQITSLFVLVAAGILPVLFLSYLNNEVFGFMMNFLTVMSFAGLHEVARELESPFQNVPNDLPLNNWHAQYNESLMTMFLAYHPDAYWEIQEGDFPPVTEEETRSEEAEEVETKDASPAPDAMVANGEKATDTHAKEASKVEEM